MDFVSIEFYLFLAVVVVLYYIMPLRFRWLVLLAGSMYYFCAVTYYRREMIVFLGIIVVSWLLGLLQEKLLHLEAVSEAENKVDCKTGGCRIAFRKVILAISVAAVLLPLFLSKYPKFLSAAESILNKDHTGILVSIGLSFFTMQIIAYLVDIYRGKIAAQRNPLKYALFVSFFPQILQGPIPRYDQLEPQLIAGHKFNEDGFVKGFMLIIWGFFLKLMIADKAGAVVDTIFAEPKMYQGAYVFVGGVLYSIQLYADFLACTTFAQGISELFGIRLMDNFHHPYFSTSIKEFWGRWHMSLSSWLRDYVYIPLGGNRKGKIRKYINLCLTFIVSGIWHGTGWKYVLWGMMHAVYQIVGELTARFRDFFFEKIRIPKGSRKRRLIQCLTTCFLVMVAWVVFRAGTLEDAVFMVRSMFTVYNPWIFYNDALFSLGLEWKEWAVLLCSIAVLILVSWTQKRVFIRDRILAEPFYLRLCLYTAVIAVVVIYGTYGFGYDAADFIYRGF